MVSRILLIIAFLLTSATAFAHSGSQHVLGTVTVIDETHIEIKTPKGAAVSVNVTKETRFKEKGNPKSTTPPSVGDRVVIEATRDKKNLTATEVHYSAAKNVPAATQ